MSNTERESEELQGLTSRLEELHERYERQWSEAMEGEDEAGAIYASGKLSGLIAAMEVVENE